MPYLAVNGDLVASRAYGAPRAVALLGQVVGEANRRFAADMATPLEVVRGDAFQGVLLPGARAFALAFFMQAGLLYGSRGGLKSRYGFGLGGVDQPLTAKADPARLTGDAFVFAAEALEQARADKRQLLLRSPNERLDAAAGGAFGLVEFVWNRWSPELWRRARRYYELQSVKDLAAELGVSYQAVHKQLHKRGVTAVLEALFGIGALVGEVDW